MDGMDAVLFIPNHGRGDLVRFSIENIKTYIPNDRWLIIVGNDNVNEDFSDIADRNVRYFTIDVGSPSERSGSFIRNYFIKRCNARIIIQKDPEVIIVGDFISNIIRSGCGWRPGHIIKVDSDFVTNTILHGRCGLDYISPMVESQVMSHFVDGNMEIGELSWVNRTIPNNSRAADLSAYSGLWNKLLTKVRIGSESLFDAPTVHDIIANRCGVQNVSSYLHYAFATSSGVLKSMRGYDEDFVSYGYEDSDIFCRLMAAQYTIAPDYECTVIHLWHKSPDVSNLGSMHNLFKSKNPLDIVRNHDGWGEGI